MCVLIFMVVKKSEGIYKIEEKILSLIIHSQHTTGIELKLFQSKIRNIYYNKQSTHEKKTNITIEQFMELVDSNKVKLARNATFHNINDCHNLKYLSHHGRYEYIVKVEKDENGNDLYIKIVKDPINKGTYNYFNQEGNWLQRSMHHVDVILWLLYGTGDSDPSSFDERLTFYFNRKNKCGG